MPSSREIDELRRRYYTLPTLLKMGWIIFKANIGQILIITACLYLPLCVVQELIQTNLDVIQTSLDLNTLLTSRTMIAQALESPEGAATVALTFINTLIELLIAPVLTVAIAKFTQSFIYEKNTSNPGSFIAFALSKLPLIILCNFLTSIFIGLGLMLWIFPGILLMISFYFVNHAISLSGRKGLSSLKHSMLLTRGRKIRVASYALTFYLMEFFILYFINFLFSGNQGQFVPMVMMRFVGSIVTSVFAISISIWYLNMEFTGMISPYSEENVLED